MDVAHSALDSLRTVEFREVLRGYHRDDVDEYLEKAAIEAEGLQEQWRQDRDRLLQAAERISELEAALAAQPAPAAPQAAAPATSGEVTDDTLQRTLVLAQKFVDETKAQSEAEARRLVAEAEAQAQVITEEAKRQASSEAIETERRLRDEIARLESSRTKLTGEVESMSRHLTAERSRLRMALTEILAWVDGNVAAGDDETSARSSADSSAGGMPPAATAESTSPESPDTPGPSAEASGETMGQVTPMRPTGVHRLGDEAQGSAR